MGRLLQSEGGATSKNKSCDLTLGTNRPGSVVWTCGCGTGERMSDHGYWSCTDRLHMGPLSHTIALPRQWLHLVALSDYSVRLQRFALSPPARLETSYLQQH